MGKAQRVTRPWTHTHWQQGLGRPLPPPRRPEAPSPQFLSLSAWSPAAFLPPLKQRGPGPALGSLFLLSP